MQWFVTHVLFPAISKARAVYVQSKFSLPPFRKPSLAGNLLDIEFSLGI
jgi:hypothetical protein